MKPNESNKIIIKSESGHIFSVMLLFCCVVASFIGLILQGANFWFCIVFCCVLLLGVVRYWVAIGRTIIMDGNGITVKFLWHKKTYSWKELKYKKIEDNKNTISYKSLHTKSCVFSPKVIRKPKWMEVVDFCVLVHPFSTIFLNFKQELTKAQKQYPLIYPIEEGFVEFMNKTGVVL